MKRGVRVRLILPGENTDTEFVRNASRASWGPLLKAGALIHEYQPTMYHVKLLIVDGLWSSVGLDQLRCPLVSLERRSQSERLRRGVRALANRNLRR